MHIYVLKGCVNPHESDLQNDDSHQFKVLLVCLRYLDGSNRSSVHGCMCIFRISRAAWLVWQPAQATYISSVTWAKIICVASNAQLLSAFSSYLWRGSSSMPIHGHSIMIKGSVQLLRLAASDTCCIPG